MSEDPKISVIMAVYNGDEFLNESIHSILQQTFTDFEFIIIDDCSSDNSAKIISSFNDLRIKLIKNKTNIGLTKSLNEGVRKAKGIYIARQDADDISLAERLEKQINYLNKNPDIALLGTNIYRIDEKGCILNEVKSVNKPNMDDFLLANRIKHGSAIFKKDIFTKLGGYNELFRYSQDYELWLRFAEKYEVRNLSEPLYQLRVHNKSIGYTKIEETRLYCQLARKLIRNEISDSQLAEIKELGIKQVYNYLDTEEKKETKRRIHELRSGIFIDEDNINAARKEYVQIFRMEPFNLLNIVNLIRSFFGMEVMNKTSKIYRKLLERKK